MLKILFSQIALKRAKRDLVALKYLFFPKNTKISPVGGGLPPDPQSLWRLGLRPQTPVSDTAIRFRCKSGALLLFH